MKKGILILLCLALTLCFASAAAETAEKEAIGAISMNGAFELRGVLPEGYHLTVITEDPGHYVAALSADDSRPVMNISIAYEELMSGVDRLNDLDDDALAQIEATFRAEDGVEVTYMETALGTKLMVVKEIVDTVDYVDFYTIYKGYEIEFVLTQPQAGAGQPITDEQIRTAVKFLSDLDFIRVYPEADSGFRSSEITDELFTRIQGKSFKEDCTLPREDLRYLQVLHVGLDGETHEGEMIVNYHIAQDVLDIFRQLYEAKYPIEKIRLVDEYDADDELSMEDNNSSSFNFRFISHTTRVSKHGLGLAVDINTLYNPYTKVVDGVRIVEPVTGEPYLDREADFPCKIDHDDLCYRLFTEHGFEWGGDWEDRKDYQHFEIPTDVINAWYPDNQ